MTAPRATTFKAVAAAASAAITVAVLGALVTDLGPWYYSLRKPSWQPPDWLFGPAWTAIFAMAAAAGILAWRQAATRSQRARILAAFAVNAALNTLWSLLFFRLQRPDYALVEVAFLWLSIMAVILAVLPLSRKAAGLMLPYLAWVSFAACLNWVIDRLNAPFA
jgi:tryptophan-rich sensory protein